MINHYILKNKVPVLETNLIKWARWLNEDNHRRVAYDEIEDKKISTVFIGFDLSWGDDKEPLLFETMIFHKGTWDEKYQWRYQTWEEAEEGHKRAIEEAKKL